MSQNFQKLCTELYWIMLHGGPLVHRSAIAFGSFVTAGQPCWSDCSLERKVKGVWIKRKTNTELKPLCEHILSNIEGRARWQLVNWPNNCVKVRASLLVEQTADPNHVKNLPTHNPCPFSPKAPQLCQVIIVHWIGHQTVLSAMCLLRNQNLKGFYSHVVEWKGYCQIGWVNRQLEGLEIVMPFGFKSMWDWTKHPNLGWNISHATAIASLDLRLFNGHTFYSKCF